MKPAEVQAAAAGHCLAAIIVTPPVDVFERVSFTLESHHLFSIESWQAQTHRAIRATEKGSK